MRDKYASNAFTINTHQFNFDLSSLLIMIRIPTFAHAPDVVGRA